VPPRREHPASIGRSGNPHTSPHVPQIPWVLEQHDRPRPPVPKHGGRIDNRPLGQRDHPSRGRQRRELLEHLPRHGPRKLVHARGLVRREPRGQLVERIDIAAHHLDHARPEAQRVLERVEAFEHGQRRVAAGPPEAGYQRPFLHAGDNVSSAVKLEGIHHITAITGDAVGNVEFYTGLLGLRMVKKSVNQDDPTVYHLFYGDDDGSPGMDLTFFEYPGAARGAPGDGMVHRIIWRVASPEALDFWEARLADAGVKTERSTEQVRGAASLVFSDPEGLEHEFAVSASEDPPLHATAPGIPAEHALQGFDGARAYSADPARSAALLRDTLGFDGEDDSRWEVRGDQRHGFYVYDPPPQGVTPVQGAGSVHHIAFASQLDEQDAWREHVSKGGAHVTEVIDRFYFRSIYFREPSGVLFEIATIGPGFAVDEDAAHLGERLSLPPRFEPLRERLDGILTPLPYPRS
jgi:glyoxalase family protein